MILLMLVSMSMLSTVNAASVASAALHIFFVSLAGVMLVMLGSVGTIRLPHTKVCAIWFSAFSYVVFFIECLSSSPHSLSLSFLSFCVSQIAVEKVRVGIVRMRLTADGSVDERDLCSVLFSAVWCVSLSCSMPIQVCLSFVWFFPTYACCVHTDKTPIFIIHIYPPCVFFFSLKSATYSFVVNQFSDILFAT